MKRSATWLFAVSGFLACPCHLPVTLGLAAGLLGGTSLGAFLLANPAIIYVLFTLYFIAGLAVAYRLLGSSRQKQVPINFIGPANAKALKTVNP